MRLVVAVTVAQTTMDACEKRFGIDVAQKIFRHVYGAAIKRDLDALIEDLRGPRLDNVCNAYMAMINSHLTVAERKMALDGPGLARLVLAELEDMDLHMDPCTLIMCIDTVKQAVFDNAILTGIMVGIQDELGIYFGEFDLQ